MNNTLPQPYGIDYPIQMLQNYLYEKMYVNFGDSGLTSDSFQMFGRVYRNYDKKEYLPQAYIGNLEYNQDMFYDDKLSLLCYFGLNDPSIVKGRATTYNVSLYFFGNLAQLKSGANVQRKDEEVIEFVRNLILPNRYGFFVKNVQRDIDNVLSRFSGDTKNLAITSGNMQPKLCFRIDMTNTIDSDAYVDCALPLATRNTFTGMTGTITVVFKDDPNTSITQTLVNGTKIQLYYPTGNTVTIPHLIGRYVQPNVVLDGNNMSIVDTSVNYIEYTASTGTFTYGEETYSGFQNNSILLITYNENN
jgi:hypothetical protein